MSIINVIYETVVQNYQVWLETQLTNNEFFIGMISTAALGGAAYLMRSIPRRIYHFLLTVSTTTVTFNSQDTFYHEVTKYVLEDVIWHKFQRQYHISQQSRNSKAAITAGYGSHWGSVGILPCKVERELEEDSVSERFKETTTITVFGRSRWIINKIYREIEERRVAIDKKENIGIYSSATDYWFGDELQKSFRDPETLVLKDGVWEEIKSQLDSFSQSKDLYQRNGIPYHFGILLDGKPGCGKSSLIHVIASYLKSDIYVVATDKPVNLPELLAKDWENSILVFEDIDAGNFSVDTRSRKESASNKDMLKTNLSTLLNALDGLMSPEGMIVIATTNHKDRLDPALIRRGRFDLHVTLDYLDWPEWSRMCDKFGRISPIKEAEFRSVAPSDANYLLMYETDEKIVEFFKKDLTNQSVVV